VLPKTIPRRELENFLKQAGNRHTKQKKGRPLIWSPFWKRFSETLRGVLRFPDMADSRISSVNHSPLGATSQPIADSLSFFYECARRKSRRNSRTAKRKTDASQKIILSTNFATNEVCPIHSKKAPVYCGAGVSPAFLGYVIDWKKRRRHANPTKKQRVCYRNGESWIVIRDEPLLD
jgi:hypothetical protein